LPANRTADRATATGARQRRPRSSAYGGATTHAQYLARLEPDQRAALARLLKVIHEAAPAAEAVISYGIPAFRLDGMLVGVAASLKHCALHPMNNTTVAGFSSELAGYSTSAGTIRFTPDAPLPPSLVRRIVKARVAENLADAKVRRATKAEKLEAKKRVKKR